MPTFTKLSHISFSARDAEASARWYREVLGFQPLDTVKGDGWLGILQIHPDTRTIVEFQQHDANAGEEFDPRRTGFDHLAFQVDSRADLETWQARFERLGVRHTPISDNEYGSVLTFKDPDAIQLELFYRPNHP
jgi:catechol-2,3-dioxygenase